MYPSMAPHDFPIFPNKITFLISQKLNILIISTKPNMLENGPNTTRSRSAIGCVDPSKSWQWFHSDHFLGETMDFQDAILPYLTLLVINGE